MKKLLILTSAFPRWKDEGLDTFMLEYAHTMAENFEVFVLAPRSKGSKKNEVWGNLKICRHKQFPIINANLAYGNGILGNLKKNPLLFFVIPFYFFLQLFAIKRIVKKHDIAIIHAHWILPQGVTSVLYKKIFNAKIKILATIHGSDLLGVNNRIGNRLKKMVFGNIDGLSVVNEALKDGVRGLGAQNNVSVCPMGIDTARFSPAKRDPDLKKTLGISGEFLLYVGSCIETKGIRVLITAMPLLVKEFPTIKLVIIGEGYLQTEMVSLTRALEIQDNVTFLGSVPNKELPIYFATADVFVLPSFSEGYSLVVREALSCETLTITTDLPVFNDNSVLNEVLFKTKAGSHNDIADKAEYILKNKEQLASLRKKGREYAIESADWSAIGDKYTDILNHL
ncbi:MAG: glycosyltransferase [Flavobacteriales bacterium]|nr:glycosyltransferase [Flavobacteriales bacterium]